MKLQDALTAKLLVETRRNPELNPKISAYMALKPYSNNDDYYISFTDIDKIGIYPQSQFRTPLGIYTYPLKEVWEKYNIDKKRSIGKSVPFAGERPHIWLLKLKDDIKVVKSAEDYSFNDLNRDTKILIKHVLENKEKYYKSFNVKTPEGLTEGKVIDKFSFWARTAKIKSEISKLWNITRNIAFRGRDVDNCSDKERTSIITNWNTLFYKVLGYYGFADKTGTGYIHTFEPVQAVFFTKSAFEIEKEVLNKDYDSETIWIKTGIKDKTIEVENPNFSISKNQTVIWKSGTWNSGNWENGIWEDGNWKYGLWNNGAWKNGVWNKGFWEAGTWENGTWHNGIWKYGTWEYGLWNDGAWKNGTWKDGTWYNGVWVKGFWEYGTWKNGVWENGVWNDGTWKGGTWKGGLIADPDKKGNFKPEWQWQSGHYVESPISPAEYFKIKEN